MAIASQKQVGRTTNGRFKPGVSGNLSGNVHRSRHALNADTIREMHAAFRQGGREAIDKVMRTQPAAFLKLLVLLVPREMKVEHSGGVKAMTDEQLEAGIAAIQEMLAKRNAGAEAKVIEALPPPPGSRETFSSRPLPHTPRIFLFLALNPLFLLLIRFGVGSRRTRAARKRETVMQVTSAKIKPAIECDYGSIGGGDHATQHQQVRHGGGCDWGGGCRGQRNRYRRCAVLARTGQNDHPSHHGDGSED